MRSDDMKVAAVILTKNEADVVGRCLASVRWCDERIVIDSGSSDRTAEVCQSAGARVVVHQQQGAFNIAEQRNWALENAGIVSEWVLFVDADEVIPAALRDAIRETLDVAHLRVDAFELTPRYLFWGRWLRRTQGFPNWHARLVHRGAAKFAGGVWEHFAPGARVGRITEPYDHYANAKGFSDWLSRHDRYSTWDAATIVACLESGRTDALQTERKRTLRRFAAKYYMFRPFVRFIYTYVWRMGFLEGSAGLVYCCQYFIYETMVVIKVLELKRRRAKLPL